MRTLLVTGAFIGLIAACRKPAEAPAARDPNPSNTVDLQAEEQKIRALEQRWREALAAKDTAAITGFYGEGAYYLPQGSDGYAGPQAIGQRWASEFSGGDFQLERQAKTIEVSQAGDMAYEVGTYEVSWDKPKARRRGEGTGNYMTVWKKTGDEWKTAAYIWNRGAGKM